MANNQIEEEVGEEAGGVTTSRNPTQHKTQQDFYDIPMVVGIAMDHAPTGNMVHDDHHDQWSNNSTTVWNMYKNCAPVDSNKLYTLKKTLTTTYPQLLNQGGTQPAGE